MGGAGGGSINGVQGEGSQDPSDKGPKRFFRLRAVSLRKAVALVAIGLCVVAGEYRLLLERGVTPRITNGIHY